MAYKQTPGRGNMLKTGRGLSPALMGKSPMKQEVEYTQRHSRRVKEYDAKVSTAEGRESFSKGKQTVIDAKTGKSQANPATHTVKIEGANAVEYDSKGGVVKTVPYNKNQGGGAEYEKLMKSVNRSNKIKGSQAAKNAKFDNLTGGKEQPSSASDLKTLRDTGRITSPRS